MKKLAIQDHDSRRDSFRIFNIRHSQESLGASRELRNIVLVLNHGGPSVFSAEDGWLGYLLLVLTTTGSSTTVLL